MKHFALAVLCVGCGGDSFGAFERSGLDGGGATDGSVSRVEAGGSSGGSVVVVKDATIGRADSGQLDSSKPDGNAIDGAGGTGDDAGVAETGGAGGTVTRDAGDAETDGAGGFGGSPPEDAGELCTPMTSSPAACTGGSLGYTKPAYYFVTGVVHCNDQGIATCFPKAAPAACQCVETYNCDCILPLVGCEPESGYACTCDDSTGSVALTCAPS